MPQQTNTIPNRQLNDSPTIRMAEPLSACHYIIETKLVSVCLSVPGEFLSSGLRGGLRKTLILTASHHPEDPISKTVPFCHPYAEHRQQPKRYRSQAAAHSPATKASAVATAPPLQQQHQTAPTQHWTT